MPTLMAWCNECEADVPVINNTLACPHGGQIPTTRAAYEEQMSGDAPAVRQTPDDTGHFPDEEH